MTIFGSRQVLFKVSIPPKPGIPAKEDDYILGEGQRQDDIEVTRIDEKSSVVTFNNHGVVQEIPLTVAPIIAMAIAPQQNPYNAMPGVRRFGGGNRQGRNFVIGSGRNNLNGANNDSNYGANNGSNLQGMPQQQPVQQIDPDQQIIMIEANRIATQSQVDRGEMPPRYWTLRQPFGDSDASVMAFQWLLPANSRGRSSKGFEGKVWDAVEVRAAVTASRPPFNRQGDCVMATKRHKTHTMSNHQGDCVTATIRTR
jgi:hypothetical protein